MAREVDGDGNPIPGAPDPKGPKEPNVQPDTEERDADGNPIPAPPANRPGQAPEPTKPTTTGPLRQDAEAERRPGDPLPGERRPR